MSSVIETGHTVNVVIFEKLISFCASYGAAYNPTKPALKLPALTIQVNAANVTLQSVKAARINYDNAINARQIAIKLVRPLSTRVINALAATDALKQTVNDARSVTMKMRGKRSRTVVQPTATEITAGTTFVKTASISQQSYDKLVDHFALLITTVAAEPKYAPNEIELKVATLNNLLIDLRAKNTAVISATAVLSNARIARNKALYAEDSGMLDTALAVKTYIKSLFGSSSPQYRQVAKFKFSKAGIKQKYFA